MGLRTWSDIVENVASIGDNKDIESMAYEMSVEELNGWKFISFENNNIKKQGKKKSLYVDILSKGKRLVYLLNTSPYSNVGAIDFVVFGSNKNDVKMFLKDFGIKARISSIDSVCQTM